MSGIAILSTAGTGNEAPTTATNGVNRGERSWQGGQDGSFGRSRAHGSSFGQGEASRGFDADYGPSGSSSMAAMPSLPPSKAELDACRRCDLWKRATQGVPGAGARRARLLLVGEQPGDEEDHQGKPFVGPAGRVLRGALAEAGIPDDDVFVTNAVKHFSWEPRGKRRIHKTPTQQQIAACIDWLDAEVAAIRPRVIVALGATALRAILSKTIAVGAARTRSLTHASGAHVVATWHPSAVLRAPDEAGRARLHADLVADLKRARELAQEP